MSDHRSTSNPVWLHAERTAAEAPLAVQTGASSKAEILRARSKALAKQQDNTTINDETIEVAEFLLGTESYAFELDHLREVCPLSEVTYIPCSPAFVAGVINLRGQIITLIDIHSFLGIPGKTVQVFNKAIILERGKLAVGFLADEVVGARKIAVEGLQTKLPGLRGLCADYLYGATKDRLVILDARKILEDSRLNRSGQENEHL